MLRSSRKRQKRIEPTIILLEGPSDVTFFSNIIDNERAIAFHTNGKKKLIETLNLLRKRSERGVLGIIDQDYDCYINQNIIDNDIIILETHDIETLIFSSNAGKKFLRTIFPPDKSSYIETFVKKSLKKIRNLCLQAGAVRLFFYQERINIDYSNIHIQNFFSNNGNFEISRYVKEIIQKNGDCHLSYEYAIDKISNMDLTKFDVWIICQGHDLIKILHRVIPTILISYTEKSTVEEITENELRTCKQIANSLMRCYEVSDFNQSKIFREVVNWENNNQPYIVLSTSQF
jgi:hypothetical protein